jgi:hypothetical protein
MKKVILFIWILNICFDCSAQDSSKIQKKISSKSYNLKFSIKRTILNIPGKTGAENIDGTIFRKNGYIYSETKFIKGIYEDTLGIFIDDNFKMVNLFNNFSKSTILVNPFYDPAEIINYALTYSNLKKNELRDNNRVSEFFFSDSFAIKKIQIVENKKNNSFIIEFAYQRLNEEVRDIINYKILTDTIVQNAPKISEYVEFKVDRYVKKPKLSGYDFLNSTVLEEWFKEIEKNKSRSNLKN